jgi:translocation and assembly module TamB
MQNQSPADLNYSHLQLTLARFRMQGPSTNIELGGSVNFKHPHPLNLTAQGNVAANIVSLFAPDIQATGGSDLELHVGGTIVHPQMAGTLAINDVSLGYGDFPVRLNALNGKVRLEGERAVISSLDGTIGGGKVSMSGFLLLQGVPRYQLRTHLSQVRVRYPSDFTSVMDGDLILGGTANQGQLSGAISIRNIFANENLNLASLLGESSNPLTPLSIGVSSPFASKINVNVQIQTALPVSIETQNLRVVSDADLRIQGTLANPVVVGSINFRNGQAVFRGNRYTLSRGEISMTNPFQTSPILDLQATTRIDQYDLTIEISGPPDRLRLAYRSDPPLPTEDILSLLAFGFSQRQQAFSPTTRNPSSSAGASALLSEALSNQVTGRIQRLFGVSRIKYSPYSTQPGALGRPVLTVEQQLAPDLTLTYETSTANSQYRVIEFVWSVNERMDVRGFRDQNGIFGLEIRFKRRFH